MVFSLSRDLKNICFPTGTHLFSTKRPFMNHIEKSSNKDKQMITRLTVDTKETKENIRKAAVYARRWGAAGRHTMVFLR